MTDQNQLLQAQEYFFTQSSNHKLAIDSLQLLITNNENNSASLQIKSNLALAAFSNTRYSSDMKGELTHLLLSSASTTTNEIDDIEKILNNESFTEANVVIYFNLASLHFYHHRYDDSNKILLRLYTFLSAHVNEPFDVGLIIKIYFLLLEVSFRRFELRSTPVTSEFLSSFQTEMFGLLNNLQSIQSKLHFLLEKSILPSSSSSSSSSSASSIIKFIQAIVMFKVHLFRARILLILKRLEASQKECLAAVELYNKTIKPLAEVTVNPLNISPAFHSFIGIGSLLDNDSELSNSSTSRSRNGSAAGTGDQQTPHILRQRLIAASLEAHIEYKRGNFEKCIQSMLHIAKTSNSIENSSTTKPVGGNINNNTIIINNNTFIKENGIILAENFDLRKSLGDDGNTEFNNNLGCVYFRMKKFTTASIYFQRSLQQFKESISSASDPASVASDDSSSQNCNTKKNVLLIPSRGHLPHDYSLEITYNNGMALLLADKPLQAFEYFKSVSMHTVPTGQRPHVWIRMAECCIRQHFIDQEAISHDDTNPNPIISKVITHGRSRRILLRVDSRGENSNSLNSSRECVLSKAVIYLTQALMIIRTLLKVNSSSSANNSALYSADASSLSSSSSATTTPPAWAEETLPKKKDARAFAATQAHIQSHQPLALSALEESCRLKLVYVHLCLSNHIAAIVQAKELLSLPKLNEQTKYLAQLYLVEALCSTGRIDEALVVLQPSSLPSSSQNQPLPHTLLSGCTFPECWGVGKIPSHSLPSNHTQFQLSEITLLVNKASILSLQNGKLIQAQSLLEQVLSLMPDFVPAVRGMLYVLLRRGKFTEALSLIKYNGNSSANTSSSSSGPPVTISSSQSQSQESTPYSRTSTNREGGGRRK